MVEAHEAAPVKMERRGLARQHKEKRVVQQYRNGIGVLGRFLILPLQHRKFRLGRNRSSFVVGFGRPHVLLEPDRHGIRHLELAFY